MKTNKVLLVSVFAAMVAGYAGADTFKPNEDGEKKITTVSLKKGETHTFILSDIDAENSAITGWEVIGVWTYKEDGETREDEVYVFDSSEVEENGKLTWYLALGAEDWPDEAPSKVTFQVWLYGWPYDKEDDPQPDRSYKFSHQDGYYLPDGGSDEPASPAGSADNPASLTVNGTLSSPTSANYTPPDGDAYHFKTSLTAGRRYYFGIVGGGPLTLSLSGGNMFDDAAVSRPYTNALEWSDCDQAYVFVPRSTDTYNLTATVPGSFTLRTAVLPTRTPSEHPLAAILEEGGTALVQPGHRHDISTGFYDDIIDESLCVFNPEKGSTYVFETTSASADLAMVLYAKDGTPIAENTYVKYYDKNCRIVWSAPPDSTFTKYSPVYVGVCQRFAHKTLAEEDAEVISAGKVSIMVSKVELDTATTPLVAVQGTDGQSPVSAPGVEPVMGRVLSASSLVHTYVIAARKDVTYALKTVSADDSGLVLGAKVYTLNAQKKAVEIDFRGSIDPGSDGLTFTPSANAQVYVDVFIEDGDWGAGAGLDYGPYDLYAAGWQDGTNLGLLRVTLLGAPDDKMTWQIDKETSAQYSSGTAALLPKGTYAITPAKVQNYATPVAGSKEVEAGKTFEFVYKYTDTSDPLDDWPNDKAIVPGTANTKYKPTALSPSAKGVSVSRSLWGDEQNYDPADWFTFKASEGTQYKFTLSDVTGAPRISVYDWNFASDWDVSKNAVENFIEGDDNAFQFAVPADGKGKTYYLRVAHADEDNPVDSAYTLTATSIAVGSIKFAKTAVSVKEDAAYAELSVSRTSKDGLVRVRYRTQEGTAKPGDRYYPASGELVWADGDNKAKTIRIKLIPDETPTWIDGQAVTFSVVLETVEKVELIDGEYLPTISGGNTATVSITETAKKTPGTIQAVCETPKKPVFTMTAGSTLEIQLERIPGASGANGNVGVKAEASAKGVAVSLSKSEFVWSDGEQGAKALVVNAAAFAADDYAASKAVTLKLTALASKKGEAVQYDKPTIASATITVNVVNDKFADSMANYAKTVTAAKDGYTVKEGKKDSWVVKDDGSFYAPNKGDLTFAFSTTGTFTYKENGETKTFTATAKDKTLTVKGATNFEIVGYALDGTPVALWQGVKHEQSFGTEGTVKASKLPDGLKLAQDKNTKEWILSGVPSKAGIYQVVYTTTVGSGKSAVSSEESYCYTIAAEGMAAGTFSGLLYSSDPTNGAAHVASVTFTAALGGKLSAKVSIAGKSYTFADTGYSLVDEGDPALMHATLEQIQKVGKEVYTNYLDCTVWAANENDPASWSLENEVSLEMNCLPDAKGSGFQQVIYDNGRLMRDNSKIAAWVAEAAKYAGYYTAGLVPASASVGEPLGNGYATITVDAKGKAKVAGKLADGTSITASSVAYLSDGACQIPVFYAKGTALFAGWIALERDDAAGSIVVSPYSAIVPLRWFNDDVNSTEWGDAGYAIDVEPVGGWYDTVFNLQRHYLDYALSVETADADELPAELLPDGYAFAAQPLGQTVDLAGNVVSVAKQTLVKDASKKLNDWVASINASNVKLTFKRASGVVSGSFDLWYEGYNAKGVFEQKSVPGLKHEGVMILSRSPLSALSDDTLTAGFFTTDITKKETFEVMSGNRVTEKTVTRKWKASYPFNIRLDYVGNNFVE